MNGSEQRKNRYALKSKIGKKFLIFTILVITLFDFSQLEIIAETTQPKALDT